MPYKQRAKAARRSRKWALALSLFLFALVAAASGSAGWLIVTTLEAERRERALVEKNDQILDAIDDIGRAALGAEAGQRGYFISLDRSYLAPYELGREAYPVAVRRLRTLLNGDTDAEQHRLLQRIEQLSRAYFADLSESVALLNENRVIDAQQAVLSDRGQELMSELRANLAELERIERGRLDLARNETAAIEARILPQLALLLAIVVGALALGLWQVARAARAEAQAANAEALAEARDRADLLARELNHRVKNLFTVVIGIVRMSAREHEEAKPAIERIAQRIHALSTAHEVTQGAGGQATADLRELVTKTIAPYLSDHHRCSFSGPPVTLEVGQAVPTGLVLHELATNAVKYGAWAKPGGHIQVGWRTDAENLLIDWSETAADRLPETAGKGFGSQLIDRAARQLGGTIERSYRPEGIDVRIVLPLASDGAA